MPDYLYSWQRRGRSYAIDEHGYLLVPDSTGDELERAHAGDDLPESLRLYDAQTGLFGMRIEKFSVQDTGDYLRRITPRAGASWWDLWRPAGTDVARAYDPARGVGHA